MILADRITMLRKKSGWSQEELADKLNVSRQSVSKWESAQSVPDLDKILRLSELFDVTTDYLLKDETENKTDEREAPAVKSDEDMHRVSLEEAHGFLRMKNTVSKLKAASIGVCIISPVPLILLLAFARVGSYGITEPIANGIGIIVMIALAGSAFAGFFLSGLQAKRYDHLYKYPFETEYGVSGMLQEKIRDYRVVHMILNLIGLRICITAMIPYVIVTMLDLNELFSGIFLSYAIISVAVAVAFFTTANSKWSALMFLKEENGKKYRK